MAPFEGKGLFVCIEPQQILLLPESRRARSPAKPLANGPGGLGGNLSPMKTTCNGQIVGDQERPGRLSGFWMEIGIIEDAFNLGNKRKV